MDDKQVGAIRPNPSGLCMCGCGRKTKIATKSDRRHGHVMGQPFRFIHGHVRSPLGGCTRGSTCARFSFGLGIALWKLPNNTSTT